MTSNTQPDNIIERRPQRNIDTSRMLKKEKSEEAERKVGEENNNEDRGTWVIEGRRKGLTGADRGNNREVVMCNLTSLGW